MANAPTINHILLRNGDQILNNRLELTSTRILKLTSEWILSMVRGKQRRPIVADVKLEVTVGDTKPGAPHVPVNGRTPENCCKSPSLKMRIENRSKCILLCTPPASDDHTYHEHKIKDEKISLKSSLSPQLLRPTGLLHSPSSAQDGILAPANAMISPTTPVTISAKPKKMSEDAKVAQRKRLKNISSPANSQIKDFFHIRRSGRQTRSRLMKARQKTVEECIRSGKEEGLKVEEIAGKGRGVLTTRCFEKGEFVVEYSGDLIDLIEARRREAVYAQDQNTGCYMYYFIHGNQRYCVDATKESGRLGRLVNHSRSGNTSTVPVTVDGAPHLILVAKQDISAGEELLYDYGDRSKASLESHPWLAT